MIQIQRCDYDRMIQAMQACLPEEACCLLAGNNLEIQSVFPVENSLHSPTRFRMEPTQQLDALLEMDRQNLTLLAIAHSHPQGPTHPSPTDIQEFYYPGVLSIICCPLNGSWSARVYEMEPDGFREVPLCILESS